MITHAARASLIALATAAAVAVALTGCSSAPSATVDTAAADTSAVPEGGTITWAYTSAPTNWDPLVIGGTAGTYLTTPIFASLFTIDEEGQIKPALAESYEYNDTGDALTIRLKPDLTFQDGTPVDAEAVKYHIDRAFSQENSALEASYADVESATVVDDLTVRLDLKQVDYQIPFLLAQKTGELPSPTAVEADVAAFNATSPVGAGPFIVEELIPGDHVILKKWDGYWDADNIHIDTIRVNFGINPDTLISALQSGQANFAILGPGDNDAAEAAGFKVLAGTDRLWSSSFFSVNKNQKPFDDPEVVEAIRYAINPDQFIQQIGFGNGVSTEQPFPEGHINYVKSLVGEHLYDPDRAREILADAGYAEGDVTFDLHGQISAANQTTGEIIQAQLADVGITVNLVTDDPTTWAKGYYGKTFAASIFGWVGRDSPVQGLSDQYDELGRINLSAPQVTEEFREALAVARQTPVDSPDYEKNLKAAAKIGYENGSTVSLFSRASALALAPNISDLPKIDGFIDWTGVTISND